MISSISFLCFDVEEDHILNSGFTYVRKKALKPALSRLVQHFKAKNRLFCVSVSENLSQVQQTFLLRDLHRYTSLEQTPALNTARHSHPWLQQWNSFRKRENSKHFITNKCKAESQITKCHFYVTGFQKWKKHFRYCWLKEKKWPGMASRTEMKCIPSAGDTGRNSTRINCTIT